MKKDRNQHTENLHSIPSFRITECVTRPVLSDTRHTLSGPYAPVAFDERQRLPCIMSFNTGHVCHCLSQTPVRLGYITHLRIHAMTKIRSKFHVTMHGYIVKVW